MKKVITLLVFALFMLGCASGKKQVSKIMNKVYVGMSIDEFNKVVKKKEVVAIRKNVTIYKVVRSNWYDSDRSGSDYRYFYFKNNKLSLVDRGKRAVDFRIKIDK
ncbi:MAG: hypothetical protein JXQ93_04835 [Flavobacteriaceae bacterium]